MDEPKVPDAPGMSTEQFLIAGMLVGMALAVLLLAGLGWLVEALFKIIFGG